MRSSSVNKTFIFISSNKFIIISKILNKKNPYRIIQKMISSGYVELNYELKEKYRPKLLNVLFLESRLIDEINIKDSLNL